MTKAIHVWYDAPAAEDRGVNAYYSVSEVDEDGDEIRCIGGSVDLAKAWAIGCERADELGVECLEMKDESGRITDRHRPAPRLNVRISRWEDGQWVWSGNGYMDGGCITDCPADLGDDVYDALDAEIDGPGEYKVEVDGVEYRADVTANESTCRLISGSARPRGRHGGHESRSRPESNADGGIGTFPTAGR